MRPRDVTLAGTQILERAVWDVDAEEWRLQPSPDQQEQRPLAAWRRKHLQQQPGSPFFTPRSGSEYIKAGYGDSVCEWRIGTPRPSSSRGSPLWVPQRVSPCCPLQSRPRVEEELALPDGRCCLAGWEHERLSARGAVGSSVLRAGCGLEFMPRGRSSSDLQMWRQQLGLCCLRNEVQLADNFSTRTKMALC